MRPLLIPHGHPGLAHMGFLSPCSRLGVLKASTADTPDAPRDQCLLPAVKGTQKEGLGLREPPRRAPPRPPTRPAHSHWICSWTTRAKWSSSRMCDSRPSESIRRI